MGYSFHLIDTLKLNMNSELKVIANKAGEGNGKNMHYISFKIFAKCYINLGPGMCSYVYIQQVAHKVCWTSHSTSSNLLNIHLLSM